MPKYSVKDPDSGVTLTLEGDSPPTEQELEQVFAEYGKKQKTLTQPEPITPQKGSWFERQAPLKGASQEIGKLPGKFLETLGTVAEVAGPSIESAIGDPGSVPKTSRTPAQVIQDVQANPLVKVGRRSQQEAIARVPLTPQEETGITTKIGRGAGGMLPYVVAGPAAPALIGLESFSDHLTNDFDTEKANGKSDDEAAKIAFTKGITSGGIQATIFALLPKPLRNLGDKWLIDRYGSAVIKRFLASRAANAGEGATLFAASRISENALDGEDLSKGLLESAGSGAALLGLTPRGQPPEQQRRRVIEQQFPPAPPGAAPPQIPNLPVPIEPGPIGAIPEGGTIPQRTRIRLTLPEKGIPNDQTQTQRPENQVNAPSALPPLGQGQSADITPKIETQGGVAQPKGQDQTATELKIPPAEELATKSPDEFDLFFRSLGTRKQEAQQQTANTTSPVRLRQYATEAANDYTRLRNEIASKQKAGSNVTIPEMETVGKVSTKLQYFNEALREAGEQPVQPPESTIETQVGKRKKPSGGRTPGMTTREAGLIKGQEKLENDWSIAVRSGKQQVNADELKTGDTVVVRGEPLTVQSINPDDGAVTLKGEKGGRWGERQLQAGQQIGVDNYEPSKEAKFETGASVSETTPGVQQVSGAGVPKVGGSAAEQIETVKPNETPAVTAQKYRVEGQGPQLYTLIERLPQSETEKNLGEQPVRVRNEKTGKEETVLETQLQAVQLRTSEEKAASKGMTKRELDDALRKFGMEPSEFSNSGQKREALKRARAKEREASIPKTANESLLRALSITKNTVEAQLGREPAIKQANLSEVVGEKPVYHETDLRGALEKYRRLRKEFDQGWTQFFVSDNIDLALGQSGKGITFELDPKRLNGWESKKPGTGERTGKEYWIDKSIFNAVDAIIFSNERQVEAFQRRHPNSLDYSKAVEADRGIVSGKGIRVPAKTHSVEDVGRQSSIELSKRSESSALTEFSTPEQIRLALRNTNRISEPHRKAIGWLVRSGMMDQLPGIRMEIVDYIRGGAVGEYVREDNVARFLAWTDADVPIHEFLHHVWRYLDDADRASIRALRLGEIAEKASQMGDTFTTGITSDYFVEKGFNRDLYHFSNDSEFFVWMMTEKALADMNKPQARTIVQKVNEIIRQLWNGFKDALGFSKYQDALWRQLLSNKYEYSFEDGLKFSESNDMRNLALVRSRRDAAEQAMNYDEMSDTQKRDIGSDIELQNTFVEPLATRFLQGVSRGIVSKLQSVFGDRLAALAETRGRGDRHDVGSYDELMANPSIEPETKQIIVGDMEKNLRDFRSTAEKTISLSDNKIQSYQQKIVRLTEDLDVQKARRDVLAAAARRIVSDYQNRYLARIRQGGQAGEATMGAEVMRQLQQLRQSPEIVGRIIDQIATTVPEDVLTRPGVTAPELLQALIENNGGNMETLSSAMGEAQRGVSREMLQVAIGIMQASDQLAENVLAIRPTINPEDVRQIESLAVELRDAARKGARADMRQLVREVGGTAQTLSMVRSAIGRLQPRIRRAARQLDEWMTTQEILEEARNDPALKSLEEKVYKHFDVRSVVVTQGGDHEFTMRNPLTNEEVKILPGLDKLNVQSNYGKLQKLFDDAAAYLANTQDKNYDPRLAAAWRYMIENTQQFWLNPSVNVFMPHMTPYQFDLPAFLSDPFKVLRPTAGLESNDAQVKLNAMSKIKKALMEWDRKTGATVDIDNKKAARASNMTLEDWYNNVFGEIAFRNQYLGQVIPKVGEVLLSGHIVTAADLAAGRTNFNYLKRLRDIAENAPGFTAAQINPVRVVEGGISRRAEPTGPMTLPSRRAPRTIQWGSQWRRLQDWQQRMTWLNDPERFNRIVVGHMDTYNTPGYTVLSAWRDSYKDMVTEIRRDQGPETIQEIAQRLYETQDLDELGQNAKTVDQIQQEIINEIDQGFNNFEAEGRDAQRQKPDPIVDALTAENSFTKPRSAKISAPFTFYDYGVRDYPGRVRMGNDVYAWYSLDFVKSLERLHAAFKQRIAALTEGLSPKEQTAVHKASKKAQRRGDEFFDLAELKLNAKRIATLLKQQTRVLQASRQGRSSLESVFYRAQSAVGSYILMTPGARSTHTFGMMGVSGVFNALVENAVVRPNAKAWYRLVSSAVKDVLKVPVSIPGVKITNEQLRSWSGVAQPYAEMVIRRREQMERLKELSIIPEGDVRGAWQSMVGDWKNVFRRGTPEKLSTRIIKAGTGLSDLHNAFWMAWSPQRYNDWILNSNIREMRQDFVRGLQENAVKHLRNRAEVLGTGYTDFSRPENVLTAQEITGHKGATAEREAFEKRKLFKVLGLDLDQIMLRYFRATDEAQASGQELRSIPFLTDAEEKSLDFEFAQGLGLSSPGNRNLAAQGSLLRRATGYIHGLPLSTMGKFLGLMNRLSNQSNPKYAQAVIPLVLMAGAYTTLMGLMRIQSTTALNRLFFNQSSALPTIGQAKTPDDWWRLLVRAQAGWWPGIGDIIMSAVLRTPDRFGHLDSMFVMWNFIQDVINMGGDMWHTKDIAGPLTKFGERWLPPIKIITRRLHSQSGVREHYNAVADIQSALPSSMETAAAKFRGGLRPTETTPLTYQALNAMYNGDWEEFDRIAQSYAQKKSDRGVKDGILAFKHSISAHNPWVERLGKLPSEDERQQVLSRMDDSQKQEVQKAEDTFRQFGQRYNTRVAFTVQQAEAEKGAAGGSGEPTAGIGNVKLPSISKIGNVNVPRRTSSGLRRISIGGAPSSKSFIGRPGGLRVSRPRRVSVGAVARPRRLVHGRLKGLAHRSTSSRKRRIRLSRV